MVGTEHGLDRMGQDWPGMDGFEMGVKEKTGKEETTETGMAGIETRGVEMGKEESEPGGMYGILDGGVPGANIPDWPLHVDGWT